MAPLEGLTPGGPSAPPITRRFAEAVQRPPEEVALDDATALIGAHACPGLDLRGCQARLDMLASGCGADPTSESLLRHLFVTERFRGNTSSYYDPRNSYLHEVLHRRVGIPISLSVLALCVARRVNVPLAGIGLPGHFLVGEPSSGPESPATRLWDPFDGGRPIAEPAVAQLVERAAAGGTRLRPEHLLPVDDHQILRRMLANLIGIFQATEDRGSLVWVLRLRSCVPGATYEDFTHLAKVLAATGRFADAATLEEQLAGACTDAAEGGPSCDRHRRRALALRARLN